MASESSTLPTGVIHWPLRAQNRDARKGGRWVGSKVLAERSWSARCDATIAAACRVKSGGCNVRRSPLSAPPVVDSVHRWGSKSGLRPRGLRPLH